MRSNILKKYFMCFLVISSLAITKNMYYERSAFAVPFCGEECKSAKCVVPYGAYLWNRYPHCCTGWDPEGYEFNFICMDFFISQSNSKYACHLSAVGIGQNRYLCTQTLEEGVIFGTYFRMKCDGNYCGLDYYIADTYILPCMYYSLNGTCTE